MVRSKNRRYKEKAESFPPIENYQALKANIEEEIEQRTIHLDRVIKRRYQIIASIVIPIFAILISLFNLSPLKDSDWRIMYLLIPFIGSMAISLSLILQKVEYLRIKVEGNRNWFLDSLRVPLSISTGALLIIFWLLTLMSTENGLFSIYYSFLLPLNAGASFGIGLRGIFKKKKSARKSGRKKNNPDHFMDEFAPLLVSNRSWFRVRLVYFATLVIIPLLLLIFFTQIPITVTQLMDTILIVILGFQFVSIFNMSYAIQILTIHIHGLKRLQESFNLYGHKDINKYVLIFSKMIETGGYNNKI
jgi:hypothetical protein